VSILGLILGFIVGHSSRTQLKVLPFIFYFLFTFVIIKLEAAYHMWRLDHQISSMKIMNSYEKRKSKITNKNQKKSVKIKNPN